MALLEFFGCTLIAFGPPFALFVFTIARDPMRVIVLIASGFFWLLSLLFSSILWFAVEPLREQLAFGLVFSVLIQEAFRYAFYKVLRLAHEGLLRVTQNSENLDVRDFSNKHIMPYVSGLGFGLTSGAFSIVNVLADMSGPGTIGIMGDSKYFFWCSAFTTLCFVLSHIVWNIIFFDALNRVKPNYIIPLGIVAIHMTVSCLTLLNQQSSNTESMVYLQSIVPAYVLLVVCMIWAFYAAGGNLKNIKRACSCSKGRYDID